MNTIKIISRSAFMVLVFACAQCWGAAANQLTPEKLQILKQVDAAIDVLGFVRASIEANQINLLNRVVTLLQAEGRPLPTEDEKQRVRDSFARFDGNQKDVLDGIFYGYVYRDGLSWEQIEEIKDTIIGTLERDYPNDTIFRDQVFN